MDDQNSLDEPGRPLERQLPRPDGTWVTISKPQTKRDNCADAAMEAGGLDKATPELLSQWGLTKAEFDEFRMDDVKAREEIATRREFDELMVREFSTPPDRDEYIRVLKLLLPDDWQKHIPPS